MRQTASCRRSGRKEKKPHEYDEHQPILIYLFLYVAVLFFLLITAVYIHLINYLQKMYETFKGDIEDACRKRSCCWTKEERQDHDAYVEIITAAGEEEDDRRRRHHHDEEEEEEEEEEETRMPLLVYVSREKRRASPHHFKAGALNALLRVSSLVSHAPYVLVLDCDMSCNTRASALEAMCFHLDRSPPAPDNLAFVQFPQMFHNLSRNDIYTNDLRYVFGTRWIGLDGLRGPLLSGTGFYVRRDALYGATPPPATQAGGYFSSSMLEAGELATRFGHSESRTNSWRPCATSCNRQHPGPAAPPPTADVVLFLETPRLWPPAPTRRAPDGATRLGSCTSRWWRTTSPATAASLPGAGRRPTATRRGARSSAACPPTSTTSSSRTSAGCPACSPSASPDTARSPVRTSSPSPCPRPWPSPTSASSPSTHSRCSATPPCRSSASSAASRCSPTPGGSPPHSRPRCSSTWWRCLWPTAGWRCGPGGTSRGSGCSTPSPASSSAASAPSRTCSARRR
ncbi:hypothetical protein PAHAL_5G004100 [Panicum hallii]|uniref:Glycosyltransferase 2-like domain-containing protein n=1 Tax=Panicum hallii TaxID=206008 RepID=A0A2T8IIC9_9POAL|nr:hypothetical protein PAHAL_5G004100 [Panicum hallii]